MQFWFEILSAMFLLVVGVKLSAFFSGSEAGFYRISFLRLSIDAHAGDKTSKRLLWFVQHPEYFVATTLVGNNISNYIVTMAIGLAAAAVYPTMTSATEVLTTLMFAPVVFVLGELMPKSLYFRAPTRLLRRGSKVFRLCFRLFLPITMPLVLMTRLLERISGARPHQMNLVLGRHRLNQVMDQGHQHGLLTVEQGHLVHGLLHDASQPVRDSMIRRSLIRGVSDAVSAAQVLQYARDNSLTVVPVRRAGTQDDWYGWLSVLHLEMSRRPNSQHVPEPPDIGPISPALIRVIPRMDVESTRLSALVAMREQSAPVGLLEEQGRIVGLVTERSLIQRFMHPPGLDASRPATV